MAFTVISEEKIVSTRALEFDRFSQSKARGHRLLQVMLEEDDQNVLAFGTRDGHNELRLFTFSATDPRDEVKLSIGRRLPSLTLGSKFAPALTTISSGEQAQRHIILAVIEDKVIRIVRVDLDT